MNKKITTILLFCFFFTILILAQKNISGTVKEATGETLIGVSIVAKGTTTGTTTNLEGVYSLDVDNDVKELVFSFIGFESQTVAIDGRSSINIIMSADATQLQEVVINALGFQGKKDRSGSTSSGISSGAIKSSGESAILNGLAGKASGVKIARSNGDLVPALISK